MVSEVLGNEDRQRYRAITPHCGVNRGDLHSMDVYKRLLSLDYTRQHSALKAYRFLIVIRNRFLYPARLRSEHALMQRKFY